MPKLTARQVIERRVEQFNKLPPTSHRRRADELEAILRLEEIHNVVIYGHACYFPTLKKLRLAEEEPGGSPRYLIALSPGPESEEAYIAVKEPTAWRKGTVCQQFPLSGVTLGFSQLRVGMEENCFLLQVTLG